MNRFILFNGCAVERAGAPARQATMALARALHLELWETPVGGCCGARTDRHSDPSVLRRLIAPLAAAGQQGLAVVCLSPACRCALAAQVTEAAREHPTGGGSPPRAPEMFDCVGLLAQAAAISGLERAVTNRVSSLRVAPHAACHGDHLPAGGRSSRGLAAGARDGSGSTASAGLRDLLELAGATVLDDVSRDGGCAAGTAATTRCLTLAAAAKADVLVTPCFLCFGALNHAQHLLHHDDAARSVPVLHLAQVLGLACGLAPLSLGLTHTTVSARQALMPYMVGV